MKKGTYIVLTPLVLIFCIYFYFIIRFQTIYLTPVYANISGKVRIGNAWNEWEDEKDLPGALYWFVHDENNKPIYIYDKFIQISKLNTKNKNPILTDYCIYIYDKIIKFNVKNNQKVKEGDLIGYVASKNDISPIITEECNKNG